VFGGVRRILAAQRRCSEATTIEGGNITQVVGGHGDNLVDRDGDIICFGV